jgi:hypothetical protein
MNPKCPCCRAVVVVARATLLMADHSRPSPRRSVNPPRSDVI